MEKRISNRQLFFLVFVIISGFTMISIPKIMANSAGTGAWIPISIGMIVFSLIISMVISLNSMFKGETLFEYSTKLVGKPLTYVFTIIYMFYFYVVASMIIRANSELVKLELLPKTPIWVTVITIIFFATYAASKGLTNVGRIMEFFGTIIIAFYILLVVIMLIYGDWLNTLPLFDSKEIPSYIKALPLTIMPFLGFEIITVVPITGKNKKAIRYGTGAIISAGILYILAVYGTYEVLGSEDTGNYGNAFLAAVRRVEIDMFQFLKRLDIVSFAVWLFAIFSSSTIIIYTLSEYTAKLFPKTKGKTILILIAFFIFIATFIPKDIAAVNKIFDYLTTYFGVLPVLIIPSILFITAKVKKNKREKEDGIPILKNADGNTNDKETM